MEVINDILVLMNILLMTVMFFYIGRSIFRSFLLVIFYTYFCKGCNACRFYT